MNESENIPTKLNNRILPEGTERQVFDKDVIQVGDTKFQYIQE
jgi:hypothetical protein